MRRVCRFAPSAAGFIFCLVFAAAHAQSSPRPADLSESHNCFRLRSTVDENPNLIDEATVAFAFNERSRAEKALVDLSASPSASERFQARELLTYLYLRNGQYQEAFKQNVAALTEKPDDPSALNARGLLLVLAEYDAQSVISHRSSSVQYRIDDGNLFLPISVNGKRRSFMVDSGANLSVMSETAAKKAGLVVHDIKLTGKDATGTQVALRVGVADQVLIGGVTLSNVAFLILRDDQQPFVGSPVNERGIIGLPVLVALETIRWNRNRTFELAFPSSERPGSTSNICFADADLVVEAESGGEALSFTVDTGATKSRLWPTFAKKFPVLIAQSSKIGSTRVDGVSGNSTVDSVTLQELKMRVGGLDVFMRPAVILLKQTTEKSRWLDGSLGMDLLNQSSAVTIDFHAMTLQLK